MRMDEEMNKMFFFYNEYLLIEMDIHTFNDYHKFDNTHYNH